MCGFVGRECFAGVCGKHFGKGFRDKVESSSEAGGLVMSARSIECEHGCQVFPVVEVLAGALLAM